MRLDGCITISAPTAVQNRFLPLAGLLWRVVPRIAWSSSPKRHAMLDKAYDYGYTGFPTAKAADLNRLISMARKNLFAIRCPILCIQSDGDETISAASADEILEGVSSKVRQKLWLKDVPHVCTLSKELPAIVNAADLLLKRAASEKEKD
jgi:esterase/lipase